MNYNPQEPERGKAERRVKMKENPEWGKLHRQIEPKWQKYWEKEGTFQIDLKKERNPYYNLMMFPYPSAEGLHVGNVYAFTGSDIHGRFKRMQGSDVFEPMGFDAFGIHSENFAIKKKIHPKILIKKNVENFRKQLKNLGCLFDWRHELNTTDPKYYKWTQWLFLQLFKAGLAYRKKAPVDWCPSCKTVLADEQVINGKCERCDNQVVQKEMEQWFFRITKYAEKLLRNLNRIDWSENTKATQKNWIGKSEGTEILFEIKEVKRKIPIVTTRSDTIFGATFLALAPEHSLIRELKDKIKNYKEVERYIEKTKTKTEFERGLLIKEKTGVKLKGLTAINLVNKKEIPIYISDFVLITYGTGAIMSVPAHDNRDFEFAKKFKIPIIKVIKKPKVQGVISVYIYDEDQREVAQKLRDMGEPMEYATPTVRVYSFDISRIKKIRELLKSAKIGSPKDYDLIIQGNDFTLEIGKKGLSFIMVYTGDGEHINSAFINGLNNTQAIKKITEWLVERKIGRSVVHYHLRDWLISRQRYWGAPIPIIYCEKCGIVPVPEKDLPVLLPYVEDFRPKGESPLSKLANFVNIKCPKCKGKAKRETDVSDTFLDSAWYFLRYPSTNFDNIPFDRTATKKWLPVDMYIGGQEHAVLHLMYSRFITMALNKLGFIDFEEPFSKFRAHGLLTKEGAKMSKSKGNVVNPDAYYKSYGADVLRMYLMFLGPFSQGGDWQDRGVQGTARFLNKVWKLREKLDSKIENKEIKIIAHKTIKKVTEDIEDLRYNTAISALMIFANAMEKEKKLSTQHYKILLLLLAPFAPHISEELWHKIGNKNSVHNQKWPTHDKELIKEERIDLVIQVNGKVRDRVEVEADISEEKAKDLAISREKIKNRISGKEIKKVIFVSGKLINIVTN